jgi:hypothetical protein
VEESSKEEFRVEDSSMEDVWAGTTASPAARHPTAAKVIIVRNLIVLDLLGGFWHVLPGAGEFLAASYGSSHGSRHIQG